MPFWRRLLLLPLLPGSELPLTVSTLARSSSLLKAWQSLMCAVSRALQRSELLSASLNGRIA
jgi:hypothetical protein